MTKASEPAIKESLTTNVRVKAYRLSGGRPRLLIQLPPELTKRLLFNELEKKKNIDT
jgi:hypothetical protein